MGQHLTDWGLPSLRQAVAVQWDTKISPTIWSNPWCCTLCQLSDGVQLVSVASHVELTPYKWQSWSVLSRCGCECIVDGMGRYKPGHCDMEDRLLPMPPIPLMDPKEQQGCYSLAPTGLQELPERSWGQCQVALGVLTPDFSLRFTPEAFFMTGYCCKAAEVLSQSFPSPRWAAFPSWWAPSTQSICLWGTRDPPLPLLLISRSSFARLRS